MDIGGVSPRLHRTFAMIGPALVAIFFAGFLLSGFFPPWDPSASAQRIADMYVRMLHDAAWFLFLFSWPPFSIWIGAVGVAILRDGAGAPLFPRWSGYLSLWTAFLFAPAALLRVGHAPSATGTARRAVPTPAAP